MTPDQLAGILPTLIQIPVVAAFILFTVWMTRSFLQHMDDTDKRRAEQAAQREKERREFDAQQAILDRQAVQEQQTEWRLYLSSSRDAYLTAIQKIIERSSESTTAMVTSVSTINTHLGALTELTTRHDAASIAVMQAISTGIATLAQEFRQIKHT